MRRQIVVGFVALAGLAGLAVGVSAVAMFAGCLFAAYVSSRRVTPIRSPRLPVGTRECSLYGKRLVGHFSVPDHVGVPLSVPFDGDRVDRG